MTEKQRISETAKELFISMVLLLEELTASKFAMSTTEGGFPLATSENFDGVQIAIETDFNEIHCTFLIEDGVPGQLEKEVLIQTSAHRPSAILRNHLARIQPDKIQDTARGYAYSVASFLLLLKNAS